MVGYPADVEEVYLAPGGIVERAREGAVLVDMTTSSPALAARVAKAAAERGIAALDAPVSGGDIGAKNATLTIMVGGDAEAFAARGARARRDGRQRRSCRAAPAPGSTRRWRTRSRSRARCSRRWSRSRTPRRPGLDPRRVLDSIGAGSAASWSLANLAPRILDGDFAPGFYVKHFVKDMRIALDAADEMGLDLPGLATAKRLYEHLESHGGANLGTQALWLLYASDAARERAGIDPRARTTTAHGA